MMRNPIENLIIAMLVFFVVVMAGHAGFYNGQNKILDMMLSEYSCTKIEALK